MLQVTDSNCPIVKRSLSQIARSPSVSGRESLRPTSDNLGVFTIAKNWKM